MAMTIETLSKRVEVLEKLLIALLEQKTPDSKKDKADSPKAKRTSGYLMHNSARRAEVKARLEADGAEKIKATEVTKELAIIWKALSDEDRNEWNAKAKAIKESPEWLNNAAVVLKQVNKNEDDAELQEEEIDLDEVKPKKKKEKKEKKEKDDKPKKKRISGYILFQKAMRDEAKQSLEEDADEDEPKIKQSQVMSQLGKMWKALEDDEKQEWNNQAAEMKASSDEE